MAKKTVLPDARVSPRFAGVATFCRFPLPEQVAPENAPADWAVYGAPFDGGVTYRPGARFGPRAVREASQYVKPHHLEHGVTLTETLSIVDAGDAPVAPYSCRETQDLIAQWAAEGRPGCDESTKMLAVGGDHSIALANMRAAWRRHGSPAGGLAVIHFDSHIDTVDTIWGETHQHGSVFRRAFEEGVADPTRMVSIGIKGPLNRADDLNFAIDAGVRIITHTDWRADGPDRLRDFLSEIAAARAYISFDIDAVDPAYAPGTGTPSVGGFTSAEALTILRSLAGVNVVGADVVEVLPDRDPAGVTALLAAHIVFEILCLDAVRRAGS
ncbi:MAG: agmatinase [Planctomycetota bacterium]|nr:MAG: agmatinase [Planctomycetota bacterium]